MPTGDASLAVVLPGNRSLDLFTSNYYRTKQMKAQKAAQAQDGALKQQQASGKVADGVTGATSPLVKVQAMIGQTVTDGVAAVQKANKEGKSLAEQQLIAAQYSQKSAQLKSWGDNYTSNIKSTRDKYKAITGLNGDAVDGIVDDYYTRNNLYGTGDVSAESLEKAIAERQDELVVGNTASTAYFKGLPLQKNSTKRAANGLVTASGETWNLPNDAEVVETKDGDIAIPKSEVLVVDGPDVKKELAKGGNKAQVLAAQVGLAQLQGSKNGKVALYDKAAYTEYIKDEGAKRELNKDFNNYVRTYETENPGYTFPRGGQLEETAKRAIAYQKRALLLHTEHGEVMPQTQYHISVNSGSGSGSGTGDVPLNDEYERLTTAVQPKRNMLGIMYYPEIPVKNLEGKLANKIIDWAKNNLTKEQAAEVDASNVIVQQVNDGTDRVRARFKQPSNNGRYIDLNFISEYDLNPAAQPSVKGKNKAVVNANAAPVKQPAAPQKAKAKYITKTAKGTDF